MAAIVRETAKSWFKCRGCSEQVRTDEKFLDVVGVKGERYCLDCESLARDNNPPEPGDDDDDDDGESHLRQMEDYAGYQAAGCTGEYWSDRDAGYTR